jgi:hypothetical protein
MTEVELEMSLEMPEGWVEDEDGDGALSLPGIRWMRVWPILRVLSSRTGVFGR